MLIGYVRVSKSDGTQTLAPQRDAMLAAGVDPTRIYEDLASGRHDARPGLIACLKAIQPGNTLVLWKLDRLGRDLRHLVNTVEELRSRGVGLKVLTGAGAQIDTTTANGRLAFGIFAAFAEFERELIAERTMAGLAAARARGRMGGRPRKMDRATLMMAMSAMSDRKAVAAEVAKRLNLTTTTLYTSMATGRRRRQDKPCSTAAPAPRQRGRDHGDTPMRAWASDAEGRRRTGRGAFGLAPPPRGPAGAAFRAQHSDDVHGTALGRVPCRSRPSACVASCRDRALVRDRRRHEGKDHQQEGPASLDGAHSAASGRAWCRHAGWLPEASAGQVDRLDRQSPLAAPRVRL
jgi:DNA invertase Pin-like site-specific DNA recombinase